MLEACESIVKAELSDNKIDNEIMEYNKKIIFVNLLIPIVGIKILGFKCN
jgi:hypothetical protein